MNPSAQAKQLSLFEAGVVSLIEKLLMNPQQPSAAELIEICTQKSGTWVKEEIKGAALQLLDSKNLSEFQKLYLRHMIEDGSLDRAIAGENDYRDRREIETGIDRLLSKSMAYRRSDAFQEMITFIGKFRDYAPYNNMLVRIQNPSCGYYATASDWERRFERKIKEDARPMLILAPMHPVMLVYDIDQTEGKDLPAKLNNFGRFYGEWDVGWIEKLTENANRYKIRIDYKTLSISNAGFATNANRNIEWKMRIVIHDKLDDKSRFGILCHELAHIFLGHLGGDKDLWWPSRMSLDHHSMEIEAEATAFIVTQQLGLEGSSDAYVSSHLRGGESLPAGVSLDNITKVSGKIGQMSKGLITEPKPKREKGINRNERSR